MPDDNDRSFVRRDYRSIRALVNKHETAPLVENPTMTARCFRVVDDDIARRISTNADAIQSIAVVPEPASAVLVTIACLFAARRRSRR